MNTRLPTVVAKFGGTSVSSLKSVNNIVEIVRQYREQHRHVLLVVSAFSGVSNALEDVVKRPEQVNIDGVCQWLEQRHCELAKELQLESRRLWTLLSEKLLFLKEAHTRLLDDQLPSFYATQAAIMAIGEQLSSAFIHCYLDRQLADQQVALMDVTEWLEAEPMKDYSVADRYLNAECRVTPNKPMQQHLLAMGDVVITQGFIATNSCGETVILGRGGSDTSAAYLAVMVEAERLDIWTDVPGMFSANPRQIPEARQLKQLDYREAQEIASTGAKVLHPRCLRPVREANIPVFVGSTFDREKQGTYIGHFHPLVPQVKAISVRDGVVLIAMESSDMWQTPGFLAEAFSIFYKHGLSVDQVSTSETNVTVTLDHLTQGISSQRIELLKQDLERICRVTLLENCSAISIVGRSIRNLLSQLSGAFEVFKNRSVHMLTQAANNLNFTFVIDEAEAPQLVRQLHDSLIVQCGSTEPFGPSWSELFVDDSQEYSVTATDSWWMTKARQLEQLGLEQGPCYVYWLDKVTQQVERLQQLQSVDRLFYAIKANAHPEILGCIEARGLGFECVSINEVQYVLNLFPEIDRKRILFTPNFAPREEYVAALELGVLLTIDNIYCIEQWGGLFSGRSVLLRVDTGSGRGHHQHVKTAGNEAKFGIPIELLKSSSQLFEKQGIDVIGLHCHVGSGILNAENWLENGRVLISLLERFPSVRFLDLGGGLGIVEKPRQEALNLQQLDAFLVGLKQELGESIELWLEPGRYLVAESGVLLAKVTQLKGKEGARYLGIETGMNSLIRPALYGAYHPIVNLSRIERPVRQKYTIVGPICETGDKLGVDRLLPESFEGDVILIANVGAYGRVMSSNYNMRAPAAEVILNR
jgi:diaminopimelate decarboxylase/aspartate kinase